MDKIMGYIYNNVHPLRMEEMMTRAFIFMFWKSCYYRAFYAHFRLHPIPL